MNRSVPNRSRNLGCLFLIGVCWTIVTSIFTVSVGYNTYRLLRYESFPTVVGTIVSGGIESRRTEDHNDRPVANYRAEIAFTYEVDGVTYTGNTPRFSVIESRDRGYIQGILDRYPVGSRVDVIYDPDRPAASVLEAGVGLMHIISLLFLVPLNLVMIRLWGVNPASIKRLFTRSPVRGVSIVRRGAVSYVRLYRVSALAAGVATSLAVALLGALVLIAAVGIDPPMPAVQALWILALGAGITVYVRRSCTVAGGMKDFLIDDQYRKLCLPLSFGRVEDTPIPLAAVKDVEVRTLSHRDSKGVTTLTYAPELVWEDDEGRQRSDRIVEWRSDARAEAFADWLRRRLTGTD